MLRDPSANSLVYASYGRMCQAINLHAQHVTTFFRSGWAVTQATFQTYLVVLFCNGMFGFAITKQYLSYFTFLTRSTCILCVTVSNKLLVLCITCKAIPLFACCVTRGNCFAPFFLGLRSFSTGCKFIVPLPWVTIPCRASNTFKQQVASGTLPAKELSLILLCTCFASRDPSHGHVLCIK